MITIGSNPQALNAARRLSDARDQASTTIERLSNGGDLYYRDTGTPGSDLFVYDIEFGISTQPTNSQAASDATVSAVSTDGRTLVFSSLTQYTDGGTVNDVEGVGAKYTIYSLDINTG